MSKPLIRLYSKREEWYVEIGELIDEVCNLAEHNGLLKAVSEAAREYRAHDSCEANEYAEELDAAFFALDQAEKGKEEK